MVRGNRVPGWCGFKVAFCVEKWLHRVLTCSDYSSDKYNMWLPMKWTWHDSRSVDEEISFYRCGKSSTTSTIYLCSMEQSAWGTWVSYSYDNHYASILQPQQCVCLPSASFEWPLSNLPPPRPFCDCFEHAQNFMMTMALSEHPLYMVPHLNDQGDYKSSAVKLQQWPGQLYGHEGRPLCGVLGGISNILGMLCLTPWIQKFFCWWGCVDWCLLGTLQTNWWMDFHESFRIGCIWHKEESETFLGCYM